MLPNPKTPLFPTSAEELTVFPTGVFRPSIIVPDVGGVITVVPADSNNDASVPFTVGDGVPVPVMVKKVVSVGAATGIKRLY